MRVGNYRTTDWHENHMKDPTSVVPGSIMPGYAWMFKNEADIDTAFAEQLTVAQFFSVPYNKPVPMKDGSQQVVKMGGSVAEAHELALAEAKLIAADMKDQDVKDAVANGKIPEIVAIIAYMNSLK
jgi:cytochrome c oxidase cbb3-type subunit 2